MNQSKVGRGVRPGRWFGLGVFACSCALGFVTASHAQVKTVNQLIKQLGDPNPNVRWHTVNALGERKDPRAVEPLITTLKDADESVRNGAAYALGLIGKPAVEPLIGALKDGNSVVRQGAAVALGYIDDSRSVGPLNAVLKDTSPEVRESAKRALAKVNAPRSNTAAAPTQAQLPVQVKLVPYKDVGWRAPGSGEEIMGKIKSDSMGMMTFFAVTKGPIVTFVEDIYVVNANDQLPGVNLDLVAGRLAINSTNANAMAETGNGVSFTSPGSSGGSGVKMTAVGEKGFVYVPMHPVLPVGTEIEIGKIRWQNTDFDEGIITLRSDGIEWRPKPE
jgi:hypothetical protein